jgi:hypothetical protein
MLIETGVADELENAQIAGSNRWPLIPRSHFKQLDARAAAKR